MYFFQHTHTEQERKNAKEKGCLKIKGRKEIKIA
jgi:hypothetical protein